MTSIEYDPSFCVTERLFPLAERMATPTSGLPNSSRTMPFMAAPFCAYAADRGPVSMSTSSNDILIRVLCVISFVGFKSIKEIGCYHPGFCQFMPVIDSKREASANGSGRNRNLFV